MSKDQKKGRGQTATPLVQSFPKARKRQTKLPMNGETGFILDHLLPFLNLPDGATGKDLVESVRGIVVFWACGDKKHIGKWADNDRACRSLRETLALSRRLLRVGLGIDEDPSEVEREEAFTQLMMGEDPDKAGTVNEGMVLESEVEAALKPLSFQPKKMGRGWWIQYEPSDNKPYSSSQAWNEVWIPGAKAKIVYAIVEALKGSINTDAPLSISFYLGCCPRCGRWFKKDRQDQQYDRDTCRIESSRKRTYNTSLDKTL